MSPDVRFRDCVDCGAPVMQARTGRRLRCQDCKHLHKNAYQREWQKTHPHAQRVWKPRPRKPCFCGGCGVELAQPKTGGVRKWCDDCHPRLQRPLRTHCTDCQQPLDRPHRAEIARCPACAYEIAKARIREARARIGRPDHGVCEQCGEAFEWSRLGSEKRFCSRACQQARESARQRSRTRRRKLQRLIAKQAKGTSSTWVWVVGVCDECGACFTRHGEASPFCSSRCSRKQARRRRRARECGVRISRVRRYAIYERDEWTCHLCNFPVDRTAEVPELEAPVLDHVIPLASGGSHSEDNLRTAHFWCNSYRRDLPLEAVA